MNKILLSIVAFTVACSSCFSGNNKTTKISGTFTGDNAPEYVKVEAKSYSEEGTIRSETIQIPVVDKHFEAEIPTCVTELDLFFFGSKGFSFIADGTSLTIYPESGSAVSSDPKGIQSRYTAWWESQKDLTKDYTTGWNTLQERANAGEDVRAEQAIMEIGYQAGMVQLHKQAIIDNPDNAVAQMAMSSLENADPVTALSLVGLLSERMKENTTISIILPTLEAKANTAVGKMFTDFEIVQDPGHPQTSTVRLSDYVGKGKYILVSLWASWCEESRREIPNLKKAYEKYHGKLFDVVSIAVSDAPEYSVKAISELGINWNSIINAQSIPLELYGVRNIPDMILFGPDGTILLRGFWGYDDQTLETIIKKYVFHT